LALRDSFFSYSARIMVALEHSKPFHTLEPAERETLCRIAREHSFAAGQEIFKEGDSGDGVYVVKEGLVEISSAMADQDKRIFAQVNPGEMFGEMAVIELKPRSASATAVSASVVYFIPRDEMIKLVERSPLLAFEWLRVTSQRLRDFNQRYIQDIIQSERLAVIGRFARAIVHDIKNPLNIISLTAELSCMDRATAETRRKASGTIRKQVERVTEMIGEILEFTQGPRNDVILAALDYGGFVRQLLEDIRPELDVRGSALEFEEMPSVTVCLDPRRLRRVFFNLIHNATDAMPDGGKVFLRFVAGPSEVITEIEDSGPGIAPEIADNLFQAFATYGKAHGTGLGLSICKRIIEDHHGRIWTRKEPGRGAIFCFSLPVEKCDTQQMK
jgi:signal transduction histidine kinase